MKIEERAENVILSSVNMSDLAERIEAEVARLLPSEAALLVVAVYAAMRGGNVGADRATPEGLYAAIRARNTARASYAASRARYAVQAAERAAFGDHGCPKCGSSDIRGAS